MKRILSLLLAALLSLSLFLIPTAAETIDITKTIISDCETVNGWRGSGLVLDTEQKTEGNSSISFLFEGDLGIGGIQVQFAAAESSRTSYDLRGADALHFDLFVSDASLLNSKRCCLELTSSGTCDAEENQLSDCFTSLKNGWNSLTFPLKEFGTQGCQLSRFNFLRFYNGETVHAGSGLILKIDNVWFSGDFQAKKLDAEEMKQTEHSITLHGCNEPFGSFTVDSENQVSGSGCLSYTFGTGFVNEFVFDMPLDCTAYDTLEFDFYVSDLSVFDYDYQDNGFEITSSGQCDHEEVSWRLQENIRDASEEEMKVGWNHIILPLGVGGVKSPDVKWDHVNYIRIFFFNCPEPVKPTTVKFDNIRLTDRLEYLLEAAAEEARPTIELMESLREIRAESITEAQYPVLRAKTDEARAAYESLNDMQVLAVQLSALRAMLQAEKELAAYVGNRDWVDVPETNPPVTESEEDPSHGDPSQGDPSDNDPDKEGSGESEEKQDPAVMLLTFILYLVITALLAVACALVYKLIYCKNRKKKDIDS